MLLSRKAVVVGGDCSRQGPKNGTAEFLFTQLKRI